MNKLLIATSIPTKLAEYKRLLADFNLKLLDLEGLKLVPAEEIGETMEDVALNKAKYYLKLSRIPTLVDAGGMEIDAINNEPGVKSHRWLGHEMSDEEVITEILKRVEHVPKDERTCRFTVVVAIATPFGIFTSHGTIEGIIAEKPCKKRIPGKPYSSVMYMPTYGKYLAEMNENEGEILDHRRVAVDKLKDILRELEKVSDYVTN